MQKQASRLAFGSGLLALAAVPFVAGFGPASVAASAGAPAGVFSPGDNAAVCNDGEGLIRIRACTRIIKTGRLYGKPINREDLAIVHNIRGNAFSNDMNYDKAIADYDAAVRLDPGYANAYYNRGIAYASSGRPVQAIADYDAVLRLKPGFAPAYFGRGNAYDALARYDQAIGSFDAALRLSPGYTAAYANRGIVYAKRGDQARAIADFKRALILDPSDPVAKDNLARLGVLAPDRSARLGSRTRRMF